MVKYWNKHSRMTDQLFLHEAKTNSIPMNNNLTITIYLNNAFAIFGFQGNRSTSQTTHQTHTRHFLRYL